jgi:uncharacterized Zn-binding protein involved in type VI secretion
MPDAARKTGAHTCPSHEGGPILTGSPNVFIKGEPAARLVDRIGCAGALDNVARGAATVLINGLPAARRGDASSHGGVIIEGEPSVTIGGPAVTIRVEGDEAFVIDVQRALAKLLPTRSGREWMLRLEKTGRTVTIVREEEVNHIRKDDDEDAENGVGTDSTVHWNPNKDTVDVNSGFPLLPGEMRSVTSLAHEMVHALHNAEGKNRNGPDDSYYDDDESHRNEERSTVGLGGSVRQPDGTFEKSPPDYSHDVPTENSFRDDLGLPRRPSYYPPKMIGGPPW